MGDPTNHNEPMNGQTKSLFNYRVTLFSFSCVWLISCAQEAENDERTETFSEVGDPIVEYGEVPVEKAIHSSEVNVTETNQETVVEGEIILGQTLLGSDDNQTLPIVNNLPTHDNGSGYEMIPYSSLTEFPYEIDWETDGLNYEFSAFASRVPQEVRTLSGKKVAMEGFMVPTVVNEENMVKEFLLMPDQLSCCFGQAPEANGWVVARSQAGVEVAMDRVIRILGTLTVEERWDEEFFVGLYHVECDEMIYDDQ